MNATGAASCLGAKCETYKAMPTATGTAISRARKDDQIVPNRKGAT